MNNNNNENSYNMKTFLMCRVCARGLRLIKLQRNKKIERNLLYSKKIYSELVSKHRKKERENEISF